MISPFLFVNHSIAFAVLGKRIIPVPIPLNITEVKSRKRLAERYINKYPNNSIILNNFPNLDLNLPFKK